MASLKRLLLAALVLFAGLFAYGAFTATNPAVNYPRATPNPPLAAADPDPGPLWVGLAFSGGGTRATAFAQGMLEEIRAMTATETAPEGLLGEVRLVTGVSGGAVNAAWFGLKGPAGIDGFRERFLLTDGERYMATAPWNPVILGRTAFGGANGRRAFGRVLDEALFDGATFGDLGRGAPVLTWINATDISGTVTFPFVPETFDALCSDLTRLPLSEAVAASAAYPFVFSPVVLASHRGTCDYREPDWLTAARYNPEASSAMRAYARALETYAGEIEYLKVIDGGVTDNYGTTELALERARAETPYAPLSAEAAVRLRRLLFLVSDAGVSWRYDWTGERGGPDAASLNLALIRSAMRSATRSGYDALRLELADWRTALIDWRCGLPREKLVELRGSADGWDCRDLKFFVGRIGFDDLAPELQERLDAIPTRLALPASEVDLVLGAAREATRGNPALNGFLRSLHELEPRGTEISPQPPAKGGAEADPG